MDDRMQRHTPWIPWAVTSVVLVLVALVTYSFGAHQEVAPATGTAWRYSPFPGIWILFLMFWLFGGLRWMWGGWGGHYRPWRYRRYYPMWHDRDRDDWEEWHRREHERMSSAGSGASSRSETGQRPV